MEFKDYYKTLGVDRGADDKAIKASYRKLARKYHPDVNKGNADRFKEINEAYTVLSDPEKRKRYDTLGPDWERYAQAGTGASAGGRSPFEGRPGGGPPGGGPNVRFTQEGDLGGFSDFFRTIFGGDVGGFRRGEPGGGRTEYEFSDLGDLGGGMGGPSRGSDVEAGIELTLEEAFAGARKTIALELDEPCPQCGGSGNVGGRPCPRCHGSGWAKATRNLDVKIPAGVETGSRVRVAAGGPGGGRGDRSDRGDLYLRVTVTPDPRFERKGDDLHVDLPVPVTVAALGGEISVPTLKGQVSMKIPPETSSGKVFRLRGYGMPHLKGGGAGDEMVKVQIVIPSGLSPREKELYQELKTLRAETN
jgi:molecular chaperone DnaJ